VRRGAALLIAALSVVAAVAFVYQSLAPDPRSVGVVVAAGGPLPITADPDPDDPTDMDLSAPPVALAPPSGALVQQGVVRLTKPAIDLKGQRRVGIQVGHWQTTDVPKEYGTRITTQTGASFAGYTEVDLNMDIAERMKTLLNAQGIAVDIIPTTVPVGYLADAFLALHCDSDGVGELSGFKMARATRRGPFEEALFNTIKNVYGKATGLEYDALHVSRQMTGYYAHNWSRYQHSTSPFTPSVIVEMGFISNDDDRDLLVEHPEVVARALTDAVLQFLDEHPRSKLFSEDLIVPQAPLRPGAQATPSASP
jgi:hypothetical protein